MVNPPSLASTWETPRAWGWLLPVCLVGGLTLLLPLAANVYYSFYTGNLADPFARFIGWGNYWDLMRDPGAHHALVRGLWYAFASATAQLLLALAAAVSVPPQHGFTRWVRRGALVPVLIPPVAYVTVFKLGFDATSGPAAGWLTGLLGRSVTVLTEDTLMPIGIALTTLQFFPLAFLLLVDRLHALQPSLLRQAAVDGFGPWQRFAVVTLPAVAPLFVALWALRFFLTFGKFDVLYFLAGTSGIYRAVDTPPLFVFRESLAQGRLAYGAAACGVLLMAGFAVLLLFLGFNLVMRARDTRWFWRKITPRRRSSPAEIRFERLAGRILGRAALAVLLGAIILPLGAMVWGSVSVGFPGSHAGWTSTHYSRLFIEFSFADPLLKSLAVTTTVVVVTLVVAVPLAFLVNAYRVPALRVTGFLGVAAYCIPGILLVFGTALVAGRWHFAGSMPAVVFGLSGFCLPLVCVTLVSFGADDHAPGTGQGSSDRISPFTFFWHVFLPNHRGAVAAAAVLAFAACWSDYLFAAVLGGVHARTAVVAFQEIFSGSVIPWGVLMAAAVVVSLPTIIAGIFIDRAFQRRKVAYE